MPVDAIAAGSAGVCEPGNTHPITQLQSGIDLRADGLYPTHDFMAGHERELRMLEFPINDVKIRAANAAGAHRHANLVRARIAVRQLEPFEGTPGRCQYHGMHVG